MVAAQPLPSPPSVDTFSRHVAVWAPGPAAAATPACFHRMRQQFQYHPRVGYHFVPHLKARVPREDGGGYLVSTNAQGFRCAHDFQATLVPGTRRVLLFGDSFTAGDGVSNAQRYGDVLESSLEHLEVYNFGIPGTGPDQHWLAYQEFAADLERDLLVIAVLVENIRRVAARFRYYKDDRDQRVCYAKPYFTLGPDGLDLHNVPAPRDPIDEGALPQEERDTIDRVGRFPRLNQVLMKTGTVGLAHRIMGHSSYPQYDAPDHPDWRLMARVLEDWIRSHDGPVLLTPLPLYYHIEEIQDPAPYQARFRELADAVGCHFHDPLPDLLRHPLSERKRFRFRTDVHYTPEGHAALAASLSAPVRAILSGGGTD